MLLLLPLLFFLPSLSFPSLPAFILSSFAKVSNSRLLFTQRRVLFAYRSIFPGGLHNSNVNFQPFPAVTAKMVLCENGPPPGGRVTCHYSH